MLVLLLLLLVLLLLLLLLLMMMMMMMIRKYKVRGNRGSLLYVSIVSYSDLSLPQLEGRLAITMTTYLADSHYNWTMHKWRPYSHYKLLMDKFNRQKC